MKQFIEYLYFVYIGFCKRNTPIVFKQQNSRLISQNIVKKRGLLQRFLLFALIGIAAYTVISMLIFFLDPTSIKEQSAVYLLDLLKSPTEAREKIISRAKKESVLIWSRKGIEIKKGESIKNVIMTVLSSEYRKINQIEQKRFIGKTLNYLEYRIQMKLDSQNRLNPRKIKDIEYEDFLNQYIDRLVYRWEGKEKTMSFVLVGESTGSDRTLLYLVSSSGINDKIEILRKLSIPTALLLVCFILYALMQKTQNEEQTNVFSFKDRMYKSHDLQELVKNLADEIRQIYKKNFYSFSLQIFYQNYFTLIFDSSKEESMNFHQVLPLKHDSITFERLNTIYGESGTGSSETVFETINYSSGKGYSISLPLKIENRLLGLANITFVTKPLGNSLAYKLTEIFHELNEKVAQALTYKKADKAEIFNHFRKFLARMQGNDRKETLESYTAEIVKFTKTDSILPKLESFEISSFLQSELDFEKYSVTGKRRINKRFRTAEAGM